MSFLPSRFAEVILTFAPLFLQQRTWNHAGMLLIGAILAPGRCTVTSLLRIMGLSGERRFVNYHRVLNRAVWSSRAASRAASHLLLGLLITTPCPRGRWCWAWTTQSSAAGASVSLPRAPTVTRCVRRRRFSSRPAGCAG